MKILFDSNIYISEALGGAAATRVIAACRRAKWTLFTCDFQLEEIERVLTEELGYSSRFAKLTRRRVQLICNVVNVGSTRHKVDRDPNDTPILEAALIAGVDFIVTFDGDLLTMDPYEGIDIVTAGRLLTYMRQSGLRV